MTRSCRSVEPACAGTSTNFNYPYCSLGCKQQIDQDQTLMLDVHDLLYFDPVLLSPRKFLAVGPTRQVARQAAFAPLESDLNVGQLAVWSYPVPGVDGTLEENFSPNLFISQVETFAKSKPCQFCQVLFGLVRNNSRSGSSCKLPWLECRCYRGIKG